jgi:hypothetical protein
LFQIEFASGEANRKAPGLPFRTAFDGHASAPSNGKGEAPLADQRCPTKWRLLKHARPKERAP